MTRAQPPRTTPPTVTSPVVRARRPATTAGTLVLATAVVVGLLVTSGSGAATAGQHRTATPSTPLVAPPGPATGTGGPSVTAADEPAVSPAPSSAPAPSRAPTATATATPTGTPTPTPAATPTATPELSAAPKPPATAKPPTTPTATTTAPTSPALAPAPAPALALAPGASTTPTTSSTTAPTTAPTTTAPTTAAPTTELPTPIATTSTTATTSTRATTVLGARTTLPTPRAAWGRPTLVDPYVWRPSAAHPVLKGIGDRDVLVVWPDHPLDVPGGFQINGGGDVLSVGGSIMFSTRHFPDGGTGANSNRCLYIGGHTVAKPARTIHIEGLHCAGPHVYEGINVDSKGERGSLTLQLRDVRIDEVQVILPGGLGRHYGGDALQTWNGPHQLRIDGFTAKKLHYQGLFLQPFAFGSGALGVWELRNVQLEGHSSGSGYLLWLVDSSTSPLRYSMDGSWVQPSPGDTRSSTVWHSSTDFTRAALGAPTEDVVGFADVGTMVGRAG